MLLSPAPAPIVRQEIIRRGLGGLNDADLVIVAHALMAAGGRREDELLDQVTERLERDRLMEAVIELRARRAVRASPHSIDENAAWAQASYWVRGERAIGTGTVLSGRAARRQERTQSPTGCLFRRVRRGHDAGRPRGHARGGRTPLRRFVRTMIVNTSVLCAVLLGEPDREAWVQVLTEADRLRSPVTVLVELGIVLDARRDRRAATSAARLIELLGIELEPITVELAEIARDAHRRFGRGSGHPARLNFGDCFSYAVARQSGEPLLFKGDDFARTDVPR